MSGVGAAATAVYAARGKSPVQPRDGASKWAQAAVLFAPDSVVEADRACVVP